MYRPNFGNVVTKDLVNPFAKRQDQVLKENELIAKNLDRANLMEHRNKVFGLQEANAKRLQAEYERTKTLRNASSVVGEMSPLENTNTALINDMAARQSKLDSMNLPSLGIEAGETTPVFSERDLRSPKAFESRMKNELLSQGLTHTEVAPIVEQRMQEVYPTTSAEARAAAYKTQDEKLKIMSKLYTGKSGTTNVNINGAGVSGNGAINTDSYNNSYSNIQKIMEGEDLPNSGIWNGIVNSIRGQDTATKHNVGLAASNLMKFDPSIDANAAIFAVVSGIQKNYLSGNSIAEPSMEQTKKLVADAKAIGNTSGRSRTKPGTSGGASQQANEDALRQLFLEDTKAREAILNSGLRGDTVFSDRVNDTNPSTGNDNRSFARQLEEANKANQKPKGGTGKDTKKSIFKTESADGAPKKDDTPPIGIPKGTKLTKEGVTPDQLKYAKSRSNDVAHEAAIINQMKLLNDPNISDLDKVILQSKITSNVLTSSLSDMGHGMIQGASNLVNAAGNFTNRQDEQSEPTSADDIVKYIRGETEGQKAIRAATKASITPSAFDDRSDSVTDGITFPSGVHGSILPKSPTEIRKMRSYIETNPLPGVTRKDIAKLSDSEIVKLYQNMKTNLYN